MKFKKICDFFICLTVTVAVLLQSGCASLNFRHEYDKGMRFYNEKKYDEAIVSFNNALNYKPDSYSALCLLGTSYAYKKDDKMAEKTFQDAIKLYPDSWNAYVFLGDLKRSQKDFPSAIEFYETAVTLESMGGKEKTYYKKLLKEIKIEQSNYELKYSDKRRMAKSAQSEVSNTFTKSSADTAESIKQTGDVLLNLDKTKWEKALEQGDEKSKIIEYGIKGEDVKNFKWTQLVTVQYFVLTDTFNTTFDSYFNNHLGAIEAIAKNSNKTFEKKIITQRKNDVLYEWKFDGAKESELARIYYTPKGIYHIHFAKKGPFTNDEKVKYIDLLKTAVFE